MAKSKPLSEVDRIYIEAKRDTTSPKDIAKALGRTTATISSFLEEHPRPAPQPVVEPAPQHLQNTAPVEPLKPQFGHNEKYKGLAVLTEQASEVSDLVRKNHTNPNAHQDSIFKLKK